MGRAELPDGIDFAEGSAFGLAGAVALAATDAAQLQPDQTMLVAGATGGVGNQAVQLAAQAGLADEPDDLLRQALYLEASLKDGPNVRISLYGPAS